MSKQESEIRRLIKSINREKVKSKMQIKKAQCSCDHHSPKGKLYVRPSKKNPDVWVCSECGSKVDIGAIQNFADEKQTKQYIKESTRGLVNLINLAKLVTTKSDKKMSKFLATLAYTTYQAESVLKAALTENYGKGGNGGGKKKNRKKNKGGNGTKISTGTRNLFSRF